MDEFRWIMFVSLRFQRDNVNLGLIDSIGQRGRLKIMIKYCQQIGSISKPGGC